MHEMNPVGETEAKGQNDGDLDDLNDEHSMSHVPRLSTGEALWLLPPPDAEGPRPAGREGGTLARSLHRTSPLPRAEGATQPQD
jgi:hypothetical protein